MSKLVPIVTGAVALGLSTVASAQYYSHGWRHGNGYNEASAVGVLENQMHNVFRSLGTVRPDRRDELRAEAYGLAREIRMAARDGLSPAEYRELDMRVGQLQRREHWAAMNRGYRDYRDRDYRDRNYRDRDYRDRDYQGI